jgi:tryptophanyl-tRNA synthetase
MGRVKNSSMTKVDPFADIIGKVDYDKLIKDFGTEELSDVLIERLKKDASAKGLPLHHFLRRNIFFSHRDLKWVLDEYDKGNKFYLYTGRGPSGDVHMGHLIPWMFTKWLQDVYGATLWFQMTDDEKFLFKRDLPLEEANRLAYENALDVLAMGFDPYKTKIFADTDYAATMYPLAIRIAKHLNLSTAKAVFGFTNEHNVGAIFYTSMQSVPCILPSALAKRNIPCLIPYAIDQDAHFRVTRDILPKLGYYKPAAIHCRFLPPLIGPGKMSTTGEAREATIFVTDDAKTIRKKIMKYAFSGGKDTIEEHRKHGGNPDIDMAFQWLTFFEPDDEKLLNIQKRYESGELLSGELKQILVDTIVPIVEEHQKKREAARKILHHSILKDKKHEP